MLPIECGLFGICGQGLKNMKENTNHLIYDSLNKLQHRGQDSYGYSYISNNNQLITEHHTKLVDIEKITESINDINNLSLIGHLRYMTSGKSSNEMDNIQPFISKDGYSISHNGNIKNTELLHQTLLTLSPKLSEQELAELVERNHDTYYLLKILENLPAEHMEDKLVQLVNYVPGVYCLIVLYQNYIYVVRDRYGVRPLSLATMRINGKTQYMVASESVAFPDNSYLERDVVPGEVIKIGIDCGFETIYQMKTPDAKHCLFEYIYFLRPNTKADGLLVSDVRQHYGELLAKKELNIMKIMNQINHKYPFINIDKNICIINPIDYTKPNEYLVVGSPSSGIFSAEQYSKTMGLQYEQVIIKQKNIRSFILNSDEARKDACFKKFKFDKEKILGKKIILGDDSLVRGNTMRIMIQVLKDIGAKEIHVRIAAPPIRYACYFGIDIPNDEELIAKQYDIYEITKIIGADSLIYLDMSDIKTVHNNDICHACFTGEYTNELLDW